ncbi:MAG: hypothetical protein PVF75_08695 [Granulosicoccaceae bacterium]|jgi:hypothetical protein
MFKLPTEPQTIGNILDSGFKLYFRSFKHIVLFALIMALIGLIPSFLINPASTQGLNGIANLPLLYGYIIIASFVNFIFIVAMIHRMNSFTTGRLSSIGASLGIGVRKFLPMFVMSLLYGIAVAAGFILLIIPGIFLSVAFILAHIALVAEDRGPLNALGRSWELVKNNWWRTFIVISVAFFIYMMLYSVFMMIYGVSIVMSGPEAFAEYAFYLDAGGALINLFCYPMLIAIMLAQFGDLRLRREGGDLEARIAQTEA